MSTHATTSPSRVFHQVAESEGVPEEIVAADLASGEAVLLDRAAKRGGRLVAIGRHLSTKVNVNLGTSPQRSDVVAELEKLRVSVEAGADTVMDLSTGGDLERGLAAIVDASPLPVGTVPIYEVLVRSGGSAGMTGDALVEAVRRHAEAGADFVTVHCGVTRAALPLVGRRLAGVVSRGGAALVSWMARTGRENPLYKRFDELLAISRETGMALSLGDGLRPGALADAGDAAQMHEQCVIGELVLRAREAGAKAIVEGPGHVPLHQVASQIQTTRALVHEAPLYVLGPLVVDNAAGWDHIAGAIGGAIAAASGAAFLCYLTPAEHLGLPGLEDVRHGVIASKIAAEAGDVAKGLPRAVERQERMSRSRAALDWPGMLAAALDPAEAARRKDCVTRPDGEVCTMCGEHCAVLASREASRGPHDR